VNIWNSLPNVQTAINRCNNQQYDLLPVM